ncbi:MAG: NAD(P)/FAD-dependent oxidoreductase [Cyanobacteriota bacterium]|nr:NAD(P)/FAD-dependent oxidoreductase [Cyanobacteriota bacterium]
MQPVDVAVVGAGLAGLYGAKLLAQQGHRVLLLDRKSSLEKNIHTTGIFVRKTLEDFQLPTECLGPAVRQVMIYSPARRPLRLQSPHDEFRAGKMGSLYQHLLQECQELGVIWAGGTYYHSSQATDQGSRLFLSTHGEAWQVETRWIVGADGTLSRVARDLGLDINREWIVGVEDVLEGVPLQGDPCFHCFLDPQLSPGYLAWVAHDGEEVHLGVGGYAHQFKPLQALEKFRASLRGIIDLSQARLRQRRGGSIPVGGVLPHIVNRRGLLLGDAAGAASPLTAGGLDPCLRLTTLAAEITHHYLSTGDAAILQSYAGQQFRDRFTTRLWLRRLLASLRHPMFLETACAVLRLPPFQSLAWKIMFGRSEHASFPDIEPMIEPKIL